MFTYIVFIIVLLVGLFLIRNSHVFNVRLYAAEVTSKWVESLVSETKFPEKWVVFLDILDDYPLYPDMLYDFRKWRYEDFYPMLEERLEATYMKYKILTDIENYQNGERDGA